MTSAAHIYLYTHTCVLSVRAAVTRIPENCLAHGAHVHAAASAVFTLSLRNAYVSVYVYIRAAQRPSREQQEI